MTAPAGSWHKLGPTRPIAPAGLVETRDALHSGPLKVLDDAPVLQLELGDRIAQDIWSAVRIKIAEERVSRRMARLGEIAAIRIVGRGDTHCRDRRFAVTQLGGQRAKRHPIRFGVFRPCFHPRS